MGGRRCHDPEEKTCLFSQLGSHPNGSGLGSGYFTKTDYQDILKAAKDRNIEIIPSINIAGRARAAIIAMNEYSRRTNTTDYNLHDKHTEHVYLTDTLFDDSAINPCMSSTFKFFDTVLKEIKSYHTEAKIPLEQINIGGDDSPAASWLNSSYCKMDGFTGTDPFMRIKVNFTTQIAKIAAANGVNLSGFEEFFMAWPTTDPRGGPLVPFDVSRYPKDLEISVHTRNSQNDVFIQRATALSNNGYKVRNVFIIFQLLYYNINFCNASLKIYL